MKSISPYPKFAQVVGSSSRSTTEVHASMRGRGFLALSVHLCAIRRESSQLLSLSWRVCFSFLSLFLLTFQLFMKMSRFFMKIMKRCAYIHAPTFPHSPVHFTKHYHQLVLVCWNGLVSLRTHLHYYLFSLKLHISCRLLYS